MSHPYLNHHGPVIMAHRGGAGEALENSPTAFAHAVELGLAYIETDIRVTADHVAVLIHDSVLDRVTDRSGPVAALAWSQLQDVRLHNGDPILSLVQALAVFPSMRFNIDVKSDDGIGPFLDAIESTNAWDRVCAASFSGKRQKALRRLAGTRLATSTSPWEAARLVADAGFPEHRQGTVCAVQVPVDRGPVKVITPRFVKLAHEANLAVHAWTINDADQMSALLDMGVDGLITDHPTKALEILRERTSASEV